MLCDKCKKNEARVYYTEIINGEKRNSIYARNVLLNIHLFKWEHL